jgi:reactive intermediate/imine deaminase
MNSPHHINPPGLPQPGGHYSHATVANGFIFIAGQLPVAPDGTKLAGRSFEEQAEQVLANLKTILLASNSDVDHLVQVRVYVDDIANWPAFNTVYARWAGAARPARAVVPAGALHYGLKLEVEAVAMVRS